MPRWLVVLALAACPSSKGEPGSLCERDFDCESYVCYARLCQSGELGGKCFNDYHCRGDGISCYRGDCRAKSTNGGKCDDAADCANGTTCVDYQCRDPEGVTQHEAHLAELARKAQLAKEARMLDESGVAASPRAEVTVNPAGAGARVRTVKITARHNAFAACKPDERLVGGGCNSATAVRGSFPSETGRDDTVGARWNCEGEASLEVTAYALCAKVQ